MKQNTHLLANGYVLTGGPGSGKTSLLNALEEDGYLVIPEEARSIIREQMLKGGDGLPWENQKKYTDLMLGASVATYQAVLDRKEKLPFFFDRGIPDTLCYAEMIGYQLPESMVSEALSFRYNRAVFILPPWKEIYVTDDERKQTWEEAVATYLLMAETYRKYNYEVVEISPGTVSDRVKFVVNYLKKQQ